MGGHAGGEIASSVIVNGIRNWRVSNHFAERGQDEGNDPEVSIKEWRG